MRLDLEKADLAEAIDQIPLKDVGRFVTASLAVRNSDPAIRPGLSEIIGAIEPEAGLFVHEGEDKALAIAICVHDGDLAGLFEIATEAGERRQGHARRLVQSALKWARQRGARFAWLQVEADNVEALALYRALGFDEIYRYHYRQPPGSIAVDSPSKPLLLVAACALVDADGRVLLAQRPPGKPMAGLWEFPGGKVEAGETPEQTVMRELARGTRRRDQGRLPRAADLRQPRL